MASQEITEQLTIQTKDIKIKKEFVLQDLAKVEPAVQDAQQGKEEGRREGGKEDKGWEEGRSRDMHTCNSRFREYCF